MSFAPKVPCVDELSNGAVPGEGWALLDRVRAADIALLRRFGVATIADLMVEKKKVKFGV